MSKMDTWFRKHDPRLPKTQNELFAMSSDGAMCVVRPKDPALKLAGVDAIKDGTPHEEAQVAFQALLDDQPHQFIGYLSKKGVNILDKWGTVVGQVQAGDSFVGGPQFEPPMFMRTGVMHTENWDGRKVLVLPRPDLKIDSNTGLVMEGADSGAIVTRGGAKEIDCHIPTLNRLMTGDPNRSYTEVLLA